MHTVLVLIVCILRVWCTYHDIRDRSRLNWPCWRFMHTYYCDPRISQPTYFNNVCVPVAAISGRANLRLAEHHDILVPSTRTQLGWRKQSFHVAVPAIWNTLPSQLHSWSISRRQFRAGLKTYLFTQAYGHLWEPLLKSILFFILHLHNT